MSNASVTACRYLAVGITIAISLITGSAPSAQAQAPDLNLQTQLNILSPPTVVVPLTSTGTRSALSAVKKCVAGRKTEAESQLIEFLEEHPDLTIDDLAVRSTRFLQTYEAFRIRKGPKYKSLLAPVPINLNCLIQPPTFKATFPFNPTYETDVLKKNNSNSVGTSAGFGSNFLLTTAGLPNRPFDLVAMGAGETSARYASPYSSTSVDSVSSQIFYQAFLGGSGYAYVTGGPQPQRVDNIVQYVEQNKAPPLSTGLITLDTIGFGVQNQTAFSPTFHTEKADLFTPQITIARQNIDLDNSDFVTIARCALLANGFCHYVDLSLTMGQTFSDVSSQQNFSVAPSAAIGWRIDHEWKLVLNTMATAKFYEDFVGGRQDLLLQAGPALGYSHATKDLTFIFQLPVNYYKDYSTVSTAAWSGFIIQPTLTVAFSP